MHRPIWTAHAGSVARRRVVLKDSKVKLTVGDNVERVGGRDVATTDWPWLRLEVEAGRLAGRWIRLTYRSGLLEPLARPVLRCFVGSGSIDQALPGALFGRGIWLGRIPKGTRELWISPTNRPGPFAFEIERIDFPSAVELAWALARTSPKRAAIWAFAPLIGLRSASDVQVRRAVSATPLRDYDQWRKARMRPLELPGFDGPKPGCDGPRVAFVAQAVPENSEWLNVLVAGLVAQPYPHWRLILLNADGIAAFDERVVRVVSSTPEEDLGGAKQPLAGLGDDDLIVPIALGEGMEPCAVAIFAAAARAHPEAGGLYADSDEIDEAGRHRAPQLRPDWSPILFAATRDLGPATAFRVRAVRSLAPALSAESLLRLPDILADGLIEGRCPMIHIRRVLRTTSAGKPRAATPSPLAGEGPRRGDEGLLTEPHPSSAAARHLLPQGEKEAAGVVASKSEDIERSLRATIIIPTKDKLDLLRGCIDSLKDKAGHDGAEVIVVDNGSVQGDTKAFLAELVHDPRFRVLPDPGPFNFSRLCNRAAAKARAPVLVFLNNDTEILDEGWLDPLLHWASRPEVGAVGAKLLYPSGRVQHAGVVIGIDGFAGHFERGVAHQDPGYFGRLCLPHEVSAVTAACLAVQKTKFDAVNGFDEAYLPVDLNDIDLCLRLNAKGWRCVFVPDTVLIHHESASRGISLRPDDHYRAEQRTFLARWAGAIRDDPYFHPALSLDALDASLA